MCKVLSGDTLQLTAKPRSDGRAAAERTLSFAYVNVPQMRREADEAYGFLARELLRSMAVGKDVQFNVLYSVGTSGREYGTATVLGPKPVNLVVALVENGLAKVRESSSGNNENEKALLVQLQAAESQAREKGIGVWSVDRAKAASPNVLRDQPNNAEKFCKIHEGQEIDAIVEAVRSGDSLRLRLLYAPDSHQIITSTIAGIRCPMSTVKPSTGTADTKSSEQGIVAAEPFGDEAKFFVEQRLLQRNVKVQILGSNQHGTHFVTNVQHPAGNIAEFLLSSGYARCVDWMSPLLGAQQMTKLRTAEGKARVSSLGIWREHIQKIAPVKHSKYDATVTRIVNGDTIEVQSSTEDISTIQFASLRQPRASDEVQKVWQEFAKEYLRKKLIGQTVLINIAYRKPAQEGYEARDTATVTLPGDTKSVSAYLLEQGFASVIRHKGEDQNRSPEYDELLGLEKTAQSEKVGIWSEKPPKSYNARIIDASESASRAKQFLPSLQRSKRVHAVAEYLASASRFRLFIPRDNMKCVVVLSGVRTPRIAGKSGTTGEFMGQEALNFANKRLLQRDVEFEVESLDKTGAFVGTMYDSKTKESFAKVLLEEGFAHLHEYSAEQSGRYTQYSEAMKRARNARKGVELCCKMQDFT